MPPRGANKGRTPTEKMSPEDIKAAIKNPQTYDVPENIRQELQKALDASKQDPTQKMPVTDRLMNWMKSLFAPKAVSYTDEEADAMVDAHNEKAMQKRAEMAKQKNWRKHLQKQRQLARLQASREAEVLEAKLQAHLPAKAWDEIEAKWQALPDTEAYLPEQKRDFLVKQADALGRLDLVPVSALVV